MTTRLNGLTILRFFAALWVLLFHLHSRIPLPFSYWVGNFFANGAYAMSLFFILSGTVLAYGYHGLQNQPAEIQRFYVARLARIYPAYAVVHVVALFWFAAPWPQEWVKWIFVNSLSALGLQAWFLHTLSYGVNGGTWSISVEFFFYALFPALLPLMKWLCQSGGIPRVCLYLGLLIGFLGLADYAFNSQGTFVYYVLPILRLPEFMLGMVVGLALLKPPPPTRAPGLVLLVAVAVFAAAAANPVFKTGLWMRANFFVVPALAWLIHAVARTEQRLQLDWKGGLSRGLIYLGEISYSLFLASLVVLLFLDSRAVFAWKQSFLLAYSPGWLWLVAVAASLAGAAALHGLVERPARRAILRRWAPKPAVPA